MSAAGPVTLVITNGMMELQVCSLYMHHAAVLESHHVIPESWWRAAGKPVASPLRLLCPTCHMDTHAAIDGLIRGVNVDALARRVVELAEAAIAGAGQNGLTVAPTL